MRLHLIIQRHGLPVTRILWTTASPSLFGQNASSALPAPSSTITSTRAPNAVFANGGYSIAQLLEDVNEVVPLETEPALFDIEYSGAWGLEDYVVEVGGSECLHFMEVEGLLRDGDEVIIRALQISDLRARRLSGRHQISTDGRHLIDGVPFGKPFLKRPTSSRPAIMIPPRKRRRTTFAARDNMVGYDEEDTEWALPRIRSFKELSALRDVDDPDNITRVGGEEDDEDEYEDYHESPEEAGDGTVIRHNVDDEDDQASQSDAEISEFDARDLEEELKDLREDLEISAMPKTELTDDEQTKSRSYALRSRPSILQANPTKSSVGQATKSHSEADTSRRDSKAVRFSQQKEESPALLSQETSIINTQPDSERGFHSSDSVSSSSMSDSSDTDSDKSSTSSEDSSGSDDDSSSDSESSTSESEDEEVHTSPQINNPPGHGSIKTRKSNLRNKMRRRLSKLKQLGALPVGADFAALRVWEGENEGRKFIPEGASSNNDPEMAEFEARRQKLLRDIESGGVDVADGTFPGPKPAERSDQKQHRELSETRESAAEDVSEVVPEPKRRTLDVASSRRLLFGSLGVRTPRTKEDEEATRKKLAGKTKNTFSQKKISNEPSAVPESDSDEDWANKLIIKATECVFDDIQLAAPPVPFEQHWDHEAAGLIRQRKGLGKKRKRRQQLQIYDGEDYGEGDDSFFNGDAQLDFDGLEQPYNEVNDDEVAQAEEEEEGDLPSIPNDLSSVRDLDEKDLKRGCVLAFKQLDVSKATNWQPIVTDYRVAEIHDVYDDNVLNLRLAKRDRRQAHELETGEDGPQYSGFEMPGYENEDEDDGFREVSLFGLIDPKLLRAADLGNARQASNSSSAVLLQKSSSATNRLTTASEYTNDRQPIQGSRNLPNHQDPKLPITHVNDTMESSSRDSSPQIKSPQFSGFQSPSTKSVQAFKASSEHDTSSSNPPSPADQKAKNSDSRHSDSRYLAEIGV
ncbi:hypothetical protein BBP40_009383 [Aspergillus hancockii]|nr:hypothetical protein BBP40_009383 [Aspergillus hancockii]